MQPEMASMLIVLSAAFLASFSSALLIRDEAPTKLSSIAEKQVAGVTPLQRWVHKKLQGQCFKNVYDYQPKRRPQALTQLGQEYQQKKRSVMPGAGLGEIVPFKTVLKDGFLALDCLKDEMYFHGDKFSDNRHGYTMDFVNLSIVFYDDVVDKTDHQEMSPEVCFDFCRTVPDMNFFGILNGRKCYCEPYYRRMASDNSACDAVCEGEPTQFCGSSTKSSIFEMHMCADTAGDLTKAIQALDNLGIENSTKMLTDLVTQGAKESKELMDLLVSLGDLSAADMMRKAIFHAGTLQKMIAYAEKVTKKIVDLKKDANAMLGKSFLQEGGKPADFTDFEVSEKANALIKDMDQAGREGKQALVALDDTLKMHRRFNTAEGAAMTANRTGTYYHAYYFSNPEPYTPASWSQDKSTCSGNLATDPIFGLTMDECAYMCDDGAYTLGCKGYYHMSKGQGVCFLFKDLEKLTHYDMCKKGLEGKCAPTKKQTQSLLEQSALYTEAATPFKWKTKSDTTNHTLFKEATSGLCVQVDGCGGGKPLSDCSLMKSYECESIDDIWVEDNGGVVKLAFEGWLYDWGGDKANACSVNPVPCEECKKYKTCSGPYAETVPLEIKKGDVASYTWKSSGDVDAYEVFVGLYSETCGLVDFQFQRGDMQDWKTYELFAPKTDKYYVKFLLASYDWTGGGAVGADMEIKEVKRTKASKPKVFDIESQCMLKFSEYSGLSIRPDPNERCKTCLKKSTKVCLKPDGSFPTPPKED